MSLFMKTVWDQGYGAVKIMWVDPPLICFQKDDAVMQFTLEELESITALCVQSMEDRNG